MIHQNEPGDLPRILDRKIGQVIARLGKAGLPVWVVGGVLRDFLMHRPFRDIDLLVKGSQETLTSVFPEGVWVGKVIPAFVLCPKRRGRRPTVQVTLFSGSIEEELSRRDFSINALAMRIGEEAGEKGKILDFYGGCNDLLQRVLRRPCLVRDPFSEDPIRVIRLVRFAATLGFSVEPETLDFARESVGKLSKISGERRRQELLALFSGSFLSSLSSIFSEEFLWEALARAAGNSFAMPSGIEKFSEILKQTARFSKKDPLFRMWFLWHRAGWERLEEGLPWSRAEVRRLRRFERLVRFFKNVTDNGHWTPSDRSLLINPDHRETIRRMIARSLPSEAKIQFDIVSRTIMTELCRPWEEVRDMLERTKKEKS